MAIHGNITFDVYGQAVELADKYMRFNYLSIVNSWQMVKTIPAPGSDGLENSPTNVMTKVVEVAGDLEVYNLPTDPENGIDKIASRFYKTVYDSSVTNASAQLYTYAMSQLPGATQA